MIINSQRTIYGLEYQASCLINKPHTPLPNTTLNEKFNVFPNEPVGADTVHDIKYLAIGTGGTPIATGTNAYSYSEHSPLDAALFEHVPFIMRPVTNDLTKAEQDKYRFRVVKTIGSITYAQYYLRKILPTDITSNTFQISVTNAGAEQLTPLTTNTPVHLNPTPLVSPNPLNENNQYVSRMIKLKFAITPTELTEINNCIDIIFGKGTIKPITEIGVCGGLEKQIGTALEALQVQIYFHVGVNIDTRLRYDPKIGYLRAIELGSAEPIYA